MSDLFVIQNQNGHYLSKQQEWVDGHDRRLLFRTRHLDEAVNVVFEQSSKDIFLRAQPLPCDADDNGHPVVKAGPPILSAQDTAAEQGDDDAIVAIHEPENDDAPVTDTAATLPEDEISTAGQGLS